LGSVAISLRSTVEIHEILLLKMKGACKPCFYYESHCLPCPEMGGWHVEEYAWLLDQLDEEGISILG
jgi:hypothetical protein